MAEGTQGQGGSAVAKVQPNLALCLSRRREPRYRILATALAEHPDAPLLDLCLMAGVDPDEVDKMWIDYNRRQGYVKVASHLPDIMEDVAEDARTRVSMCRNCDGLGRMEDQPEFPLCPICDGSGKVRKIGDHRSRELVFEAMKITSKEPIVNINNSFSLEGLVGEATRIIRSSSKVVDVDAQ